jgi:hypothetical protein
MQLKARLVHADAGVRVVEVSAWNQGQCLGSALGEAANAEAAEERALERLQQRLHQPGSRPGPAPGAAQSALPHQQVRPPAPAQPPVPKAPTESQTQSQTLSHTPSHTEPSAEPPAELAADPDDWSDELADLDLELRRIGWEREQEAAYLQRAFGHPSRSRLTAYRDLSAYLKTVRLLQAGTDPNSAPVPLRRADLLSQSDQLLQSLRWDASHGRSFLEQHFQLSSRQQLSDEQLLHFNMLLESELIGMG